MQTRQPRSLSMVNPSHWWYASRASIMRVVFEKELAGVTLLDIGSSDGPSVAWIDHVGTRIPIDTDMAALQPGGTCASALSMPIRDRAVQGLSAFDVVEHFPDDLELLREIHRVLRPGGLFLLSVPAYQWAWSSWDLASGHYRRYTRRQIVSRLAASGFVVDRSTYAFAGTFAFFVADRVVPRLLGRQAVGGARTHGVLARMLAALCRLDRWLLERVDLPFGSSILVTAHKPPRNDGPDP